MGDFWKPTLGLIPVQLMAFHGWSQVSTTSCMLFLQPFGLMCMPLMQKLIDNVGYHKAWKYTLYYIWALLPAIMLTIPWNGYVAYALFALLTMASGFNPFK